MKKIIAISVMLALVAGAVFADTAVGGNLKISTNLLMDDGGDDVMAGGATIWDAYTNVNWSGENAGGMMRLHSFGQGKSPISWTPDAFVFWWWKPIDQLKVQLGVNPDADWGHAQISGWGFNAEAQGGVAIDKDRELGSGSYTQASSYNDTAYLFATGTPSVVARTAAWWGGFNSLGLAISIFPAQGFEIDLGIPMGNKATAAQTYLSSKINFKVDIPDIGTIRLAADLQGKDADDSVITPNIHFAFYLSAIENMGLEISGAYKTKPAGTQNTAGSYAEFTTTEVGLGFRYNAEDLTIKARAGFVMFKDFAGDDSLIGINILPSYNLGSFVFYFNAGFGMALDNSDFKDWYVNPYIRVPAKAGNFYAGIKAQGVGDADVTWSIPIGWNVYF
jgi:hypothetical protein